MEQGYTPSFVGLKKRTKLILNFKECQRYAGLLMQVHSAEDKVGVRLHPLFMGL